MTTPRHCGGKTRAGGSCARPKGWGTDHPGTGRCKLHGGSTPNGRKSAQREQAVTAVATYGLPREVDPHAALVEELHRTAGHVAWLGLKVAELQSDHLYGPVGGGEHSIPRQEPHVWVGLYQAERKHFTEVAKTCIACGIAERQVALAEQQGQIIAQVLQAVARDMGIDKDPRLPGVVRRHLTAIPGGKAA